MDWKVPDEAELKSSSKSIYQNTFNLGVEFAD